MADQPNRAYRHNDGRGRTDQRTSGSGSDPLAELARLISGQNDPFAQPRHAGAQDAAEWYPSAERPDPRAANGGYQNGTANGGYAQSAPGQDGPYAGGYDHGAYAREPEQRTFTPPPFPAAAPGYGDTYYDDAAHGEEMYDEAAPARRRGGMLTVTAVLALALIGTAAAFGYRAVFGNSNSAPPPVIKADTTPSKIVPATTPSEQAKQIYDRVGDRSQPERVVSREEKPVDVNGSLAPRVIAGAPVNPIAAPQSPPLPPNASALAAPTSPSAGAPKRVRTVIIKPDGPDADAPPARTSAAQAAPPAARGAPAPQAETVSPPPAQIPARTVAPRQVQQHVAAAAPANQNAPLSLTPPPAGATASARAPTPMRTASAPPAHVAPVAGGAYSVQVSSQRSEAEAQASFHALQAKFPSQLGGQQPMIRRADLGDKGVFYRVQVGPFGTADQATQLCASLKSAGGQCVVQRN